MGATASVPARDSAKRALWERLCSLDDACKAVQSRSGAASEEVRARRRLINGVPEINAHARIEIDVIGRGQAYCGLRTGRKHRHR